MYQNIQLIRIKVDWPKHLRAHWWPQSHNLWAFLVLNDDESNDKPNLQLQLKIELHDARTKFSDLKSLSLDEAIASRVVFVIVLGSSHLPRFGCKLKGEF